MLSQCDLPFPHPTIGVAMYLQQLCSTAILPLPSRQMFQNMSVALEHAGYGSLEPQLSFSTAASAMLAVLVEP